jgi:cytochrome b6-f complex iron-sulfur subunit
VKRRAVLKALALGGSSLALLTRTHAAEYALNIAPFTTFKAEWDAVEFDWTDGPALLLRVPKPLALDKALLEVGGFYLTAYLRVCTHEGCTVKLPGDNRKLECPCHGSVFNATDGSPHSGIAGSSLQRLQLELRGEDVYAVGFYGRA